MEHVKLIQSAGTLALYVHAFQEVGIAFGVEDNNHLAIKVHLISFIDAALAPMNRLNTATHLNAPAGPPAGAPDVLGDKQFGQAGFAHSCSTQHQGVPNPLTQWQADVSLVRFYAV
ncbi:hypothetical protein H096_13911 [Pseudomonas sp. FH1]|nr:hypothetical protein H096_13911 [Pseudomonas sp. FH1]